MLGAEDIERLIEVSTARGTGDVSLACLQSAMMRSEDDPVLRMAIEIARYRLGEHWRKVGAKPTPPTAPPEDSLAQRLEAAASEYIVHLGRVLLAHEAPAGSGSALAWEAWNFAENMELRRRATLASLAQSQREEVQP
jgi:hypothetical protein